MWNSTSRQRICVLPLKMPWSSSEDTFMMHCKPSTLLRKIHEHFGSLWLIALITKMTSSCLKQDMAGSICVSKTLSLRMNIILKFVESDHLSSFVIRTWLKRIFWRRPIRPFMLPILSCSNNIGLRSSLSFFIWYLFYLSLKTRISCWWKIIKLDLLGQLMCLKHIIAQIKAQNANIGVVGAARSHPIKVNTTKAYLREQTEPISALTSLSRPQTSRIRAKHLKTMDANLCYRCQVDEPKSTKIEVFDFRRLLPLWKIRILDINYFISFILE